MSRGGAVARQQTPMDLLSDSNRTLVATLALSNPADTFDSNDIKAGV